MDHSVKAMNSHRKLAFSRLLNRHRFENDELESLYQRYIFKLQHSSVASVVALFVILTGVLANLSLAYAQAPTAQNIYHSLHCLLFALLLVFLNTRLMQDAYLLWVCYAILFFCTTFCAVALPLGMCNFIIFCLRTSCYNLVCRFLCVTRLHCLGVIVYSGAPTMRILTAWPSIEKKRKEKKN